MRPRRHADQLLPGARQRARARGRRSDAQPSTPSGAAHRREVIVGDKGFAGQEFEQIVAAFDATLIRPDRKGERPRFGKLGRISQWIESVYQTTKGQLSLELHGGNTPAGVWARICQRVPALAAGVWHSWQLWQAGEIDAPGRHFTLYDH